MQYKIITGLILAILLAAISQAGVADARSPHLQVDTLRLGDANCSGTETILDAQLIAQYDAGLWDGKQERCPDLGQWVMTRRGPMRWGDWNRDWIVDIVDALTTAQRVAGIALPLPQVRIAWLVGVGMIG